VGAFVLSSPTLPSARYQSIIDNIAMSTDVILAPAPELQPPSIFTLTPKAAKRVLEFFTGQINNDHTRTAYLNAIGRFSGGTGRIV
jgi:hypothetical protein